jgi:iron complex transport system ATP-binding protein
MSRISIENLKYRYVSSNMDVLKGVSSKFPEGKVTTLLGPNGSGKSTLFKVLLKILTPYEGKIYVDGEDINNFERNHLSRLVAWVPQEEDSFFPYNVLEYVLMGRAPHIDFLSLPNRKDEEIVNGVLCQLELSNLANRKVASLSGGEKRMVSIARALSQESNILVLDEPTAHLDLGNKARVLHIIRRMADSGKTVVFSTHDPNEVSLVSDNVVIMNGGDVVSSGSPATTLTKDVLEKIYGTQVIVDNVNGKPVVGLDSESFKPALHL